MTLAEHYEQKGVKLGMRKGRKEGERAGIKKGEQAGIKKGEQLGFRKGEQFGIKQGQDRMKLTIAQQMLKDGHDKNYVLELMKLQPKDIELQ